MSSWSGGRLRFIDHDAEQRLRIEELKRRIREETGETPIFGSMSGCPPDLEEDFLRRVLEFETAEEESLFSALAHAGVALPNPDELGAAQTTAKLWEVIHAFADLGVFLHSTDHLSDHELYASLWSDELLERVRRMPHNPSYAYHIDMTGAGGEDEEQTYLRYYADGQARRRYAIDFPGAEIPEHREPPYDRDRLLPDG